MQRFYQLVRLIMYQPFSGMYGCPLAMTDGAAYVLQKLLNNNKLKGKSKYQA